MTSIRRRALGVVALLAAAGLVLPSSAWAADLPVPTDAEIAESISSIDLNVGQFTANIEELEEESKDGEETVLSLNSDVLFAFGKSAITTGAKARIGKVVADLPKNARVTVGGHTDSIGDTKSNQTLSEARAKTVAAAVKTARADLRLTVRGYGESQPIEPNTSGGKDDPDARAKNRRVELRFTS